MKSIQHIDLITPIDQAAALVVQAFQEEALTSVWLDFNHKLIRRAYEALIKEKLRTMIQADQPVIAAISEKNVVGIAVVKSPGMKIGLWPRLKGMVRSVPKLIILLPSVVRALRIGCLQLKPPSSLPENRFSLEAIAVHPDYQGQRIGSRFLDEVHRLSEQAEKADGIYLYTGSDENVALYKRFGYTVVDTVDGKGFRAYHMFRKQIKEGQTPKGVMR